LAGSDTPKPGLIALIVEVAETARAAAAAEEAEELAAAAAFEEAAQLAQIGEHTRKSTGCVWVIDRLCLTDSLHDA
jgi:hypothetical protein